MTLLAFIEAFAYAIARGVTRAWLDVIGQRSSATEENVNSADQKRAQAFKDAIATMKDGK